LTSVSNPFGYINLIDPYAGGVFNPSVLVLPDAVGLGWRHLLVARGEEKYEQINGEDTRWEKVLGCFLLPMKRAHLELPYLARESELETLDLPAKRKVDYLRCHDPVYDQVRSISLTHCEIALSRMVRLNSSSVPKTRDYS